MSSTVTPYGIEEHKRRYVAWAASRAASTISCRFEVSIGRTIIEATGLHSLLSDAALLPVAVK